MLVWIFFGRPVAIKKMGRVAKMALQSVTLSLKLSFKLKCLIFQTNEEGFTFVAFKTDSSSNGSACIQEFVFEVRLKRFR